MDIGPYQASDVQRLFATWSKVGRDVPYFFPVSAPIWETCLLRDRLAGEAIFKSLETHLATEHGEVLGFVQWGQPNFAWDDSGQRYDDPELGVIRHLYFNEGRDDVGGALLAKACGHLARFERKHAFYHAFGMSCNAHHGKLHTSQSHVERLLQRHGFRIEHENAYYVLDMQDAAPVKKPQLDLRSAPDSADEWFELRLRAEVVGTARVRPLDALTGGHTHDAAYLTWIGVAEQHRRQGLGAEFLKLLAQSLVGRGYRCLHTDTASGNVRAQRLYRKVGFRHKGHTRSYVQPTRCEG